MKIIIWIDYKNKDECNTTFENIEITPERLYCLTKIIFKERWSYYDSFSAKCVVSPSCF